MNASDFIKQTMTWDRFEFVLRVGLRRWCWARRDGRQYDKGQHPQYGLLNDFQCAVSEYFCHQWTGVLWVPAMGWLDTKRGDLVYNGKQYQIRSDADYDGAEMPFRPNDPEDHGYILVHVPRLRPYAIIMGWMEGRECKSAGYVSNKGNPDRAAARFIPWTELHPAREIIESKQNENQKALLHVQEH